MKEYVMIPFTVHKDRIEERRNHKWTYLKCKGERTQDVAIQSLQLKKDPASFIHFIIFADNEAHMRHRSARMYWTS